MRCLLLVLFCFVAFECYAEVSCEDLLFYREQNRKFNEQLKLSSNKKPIEKWLRSYYKNPIVEVEQELRSGQIIQIGPSDFKQPTDLILNSGGRETVLFSTKSMDAKLSIASFAISHNERYVAVSLYEKGSIDDFTIVIVNIRTGKVLKKKIKSTLGELFWMDNNRLLIGTDVENFSIAGVTTFYRKSGVSRTKKVRMDIGPGGDWALIYYQGDTLLLNQRGDRYSLDLDINYDGDFSVAGTLGRKIIMTKTDVSKNDIYFIDKPTAKTGVLTPELIYETEDRVIDEVSMLDETNGFTMLSHWGADRWISLFDLEGHLTQEIPVPLCCVVSGTEWSEDGTKMHVTLTSQFHENIPFVYNLKTEKWSDPWLEKKMLKYNGVQMKTTVVEVESEDGTKIPMRVTQRADLKKNGRNPVLLQVYGDRSPGYLDPSFDKWTVDFIERGGILAGPGVRGGTEFGTHWVGSALDSDKINTMKDLIAGQKWFVQKRWSRPEYIMTTGTSHGGFVVASAALLDPKAVGLAIPIAGVYDTLNVYILRQDYPDITYTDFGDYEVSPVWLAENAEDIPKMLLIVGDSDSRVNSKHTWNLARTLLEHPEAEDKVRVVTMKNAGHWLESHMYQSIHAWRTSVVFWTAIYDHLGWTFTTEASSQGSRRKN